MKRLHPYQIRQFRLQKFDISRRTADIFISRARKYLRDPCNRARDDFVAEAVGFCKDILREPESERFEKPEPQGALGNMLGLDSPFKIAPTRPDGQSAYIPATIIAALSDDELAVMRRIHFRVQNQRALEDGRTIDDCKLLTASLVENGHLPGGPDISGLVIGVEGRASAAEPSRPSGHGCLRVTPQITLRLGIQNEFAGIPGFPQSMPGTFLCLFSL